MRWTLLTRAPDAVNDLHYCVSSMSNMLNSVLLILILSIRLIWQRVKLLILSKDTITKMICGSHWFLIHKSQIETASITGNRRVLMLGTRAEWKVEKRKSLSLLANTRLLLAPFLARAEAEALLCFTTPHWSLLLLEMCSEICPLKSSGLVWSLQQCTPLSPGVAETGPFSCSGAWRQLLCQSHAFTEDYLCFPFVTRKV